MKKIIAIVVTVFFAIALSAQTPKGTYIPKNDLAKSLYYEKFVFSGSKVKMYFSANGISLGVSYEYSYTLSGNTLSIKEGAGSVDFTYNKTREEISLLTGLYDTEGAVWGKEGTFDPNNPYPKKEEEKTDSVERDKPNTSDNKKPEQGSNTKGSWNYNPYTFYQELAEKCALYSKYVYEIADIVEELTVDGYNVKIADYYDNKKENGIGYILAHKTVNRDETLLTVVVRGTVEEEWKGNMDISVDKYGETTGLHKNFMSATWDLKDAITKYIKKYDLKNINFLITGHSRGAAVANILAIYLDNETFEVSQKNKVFAYAFATPNYSSDLENDGYNYNNIFNFCFRDDFVTRVPLEEWEYGKVGLTYWAVAENLNKINPTFKNSVKGKVFNYQAVKNLLPAMVNIAPTISDYYDETKIDMGLGHKPRKISLYTYMRNYVAQAQIDGLKNLGSAGLSLLWDAGKKSADVYEIADFLIDGALKNTYIADTHDMWTYYYALTTNGFLTK